MAAHTLYEAAKLSRNPLTAGVLKAIATSDQMLAKLPMVRKTGESFSYNREKTLPSMGYLSPTHTSMEESAATFAKVTVPMRILGGNVDVMVFTEEQQNDTNGQQAIQLEKKLKTTGRTIANKAINGSFSTSVTVTPAITGVTANYVGALQDTNRHGAGDVRFNQGALTLEFRGSGDRTYGAPVSVASNGTYILQSDNPQKILSVTVVTASLPGSSTEANVYNASTTEEPDGLNKLIPTSQVRSSVGTNGDALSFAILDQLIDLVKVRNDRAFVMNSALVRKYFDLVRSLNGTDPMHITLPSISGQVPVYRGIPILENDWIGSSESKGSGTTLSSAYLIDFSPEEGFYAGVSQGAAVNFDNDPRETRIMGVKVRSIGELEDKEAIRTRVTWYGAYALGSDLAAARATELVTA